MNIFDLFSIGKVALKDEGVVKDLIAHAKDMSGPKPSWKTGEFWVNMVLPAIAMIAGSLGAFVPSPMTPYFLGGLLVISIVGYLGRTTLKIAHLWAIKGASVLADPSVLVDLQANVSTVAEAVKALQNVKTNPDAVKVQADVLAKAA
jgi:hypothetical protein